MMPRKALLEKSMVWTALSRGRTGISPESPSQPRSRTRSSPIAGEENGGEGAGKSIALEVEVGEGGQLPERRQDGADQEVAGEGEAEDGERERVAR